MHRDEERTEAAAVTIVEVVIEVEAVKEPTPSPIVMRIDRPFIFFIRDIETNVILFVGREMNPAQ